MTKLPRPFDYWTTYPGHSGIDFPVADDVMVKASGNGVVVQSGYWNIRGGYGVIVRYSNGVELGYCHSDKNDWRIKLGTKVKLGSNLMEVGSLGKNSTGPHLHQDVRVNGVIIPPPAYWNYVDKSDNGFVAAVILANNSKPKPLPTPTPKPPTYHLEEMEMRFIYVRADKTSTIYKVDLETGKSKPMTPTQWSSVVASYKKLNLPDPLANIKVSEDDLKKAWPLS